MTLGLYIDPGVHKLACAWFKDGRLIALSMNAREEFMTPGVPCAIDPGHFWIERMRIYKGAPRSEDPNDLIDVTGASHFVEACIAMRGGPRAQYVFAADWKGQIKKPQHHRRLWSVLDPTERGILARAAGMTEAQVTQKIEDACRRLALTRKVTGYAWEAHNLFDAVGIGLWHTKRTGRAGHRFSLQGELNLSEQFTR